MQGTHSLSRDGHMQEADGQGPGAVPLRRRWGEEPGGDVPYWSVVRTLKAGAEGDASHSGGQAPGLGRRTGGLGTAAAAEQHDLSQWPQEKRGPRPGTPTPRGSRGRMWDGLCPWVLLVPESQTPSHRRLHVPATGSTGASRRPDTRHLETEP